MMDIAKSETFKKFIILNKALLFLIKLSKIAVQSVPKKYTLSWNKKSPQNMSEIFDMVHMSQIGNLAEVSRDFRDIIS